MTTTVAPDDYLPPPVPDAPYVIGSGAGLKHAVAWTVADTAVKDAPHERHRAVSTACGAMAELVTGWGGFVYGNRRLATNRCPTCGWAVAIELDLIEAELSAIAPSPSALPALTRLLDEPFMAVRVCEAILADDGDYERDHPHIAHLLGHATAHAPALLVPEDCAENGCEHRPDERWDDTTWECPSPQASAACGVCSARAGSYAGEWVGQFTAECTVLAPCSVLTTFADHYGIAIGSRRKADA